jgi:hypothetical protein
VQSLQQSKLNPKIPKDTKNQKKQEYTVEKEWRNLKYSVNSEDITENYEELVIDNVIIKQLATHNEIKQHDDETKISKLQDQSHQRQLTANKTDSNTLKKTSKTSAKQGKSIIPARRWFRLISFYGSLNKTDSPKELRPLDNTHKNTIIKTRTYTRSYLNNTNIYIKNPTSTKYYLTTTNKSRYKRILTTECKPNFSEIKGQCKGQTTTLQTKIMAPKTSWIHILIISADPNLKLAPKTMWILLSADHKLAPKNFWNTTPVKSAEVPLKYKQVPKTILIQTKTEIAPNMTWIHNSTARFEFAPKIAWIHNCAVKNKPENLTLILLQLESALETYWIHIHTIRVMQNTTPILNCAAQNNLTNLANLTLIQLYIELVIVRMKLESNILL